MDMINAGGSSKSRPEKNIGGSKGDEFYRYKMPDLVLKVEKPGTNGQKTIVLNIDAVSKSLNVPPEWLTRFFSYEMGGQATYQQAENGGRTATTVMGNHTKDKFDQVVEKFIQMFILCSVCKLPEVRISVKNNKAKLRCASCGNKGVLNTGHRLDNFIVKNPPPKKEKAHSMPDGEDERDQKQGAPAPAGAEENEENGIPQPEEKSQLGGWSVDTSAEAQLKRRKEFEKKDKKKVVVSVEAPTTPQGILKEAHDRAKQEGVSKKDLVAAVIAELDRLSLKHGYDDKERFRVLMEALVPTTEPKLVAKNFGDHSRIFKKAIAVSKGGKSHGASTMIGVVMIYLSEDPELLKRFPLVLKAFFDGDVLSEKAILTWADSPVDTDTWAVEKEVATEFRTAAKVFIDWLKSSEDSD